MFYLLACCSTLQLLCTQMNIEKVTIETMVNVVNYLQTGFVLLWNPLSLTSHPLLLLAAVGGSNGQGTASPYDRKLYWWPWLLARRRVIVAGERKGSFWKGRGIKEQMKTAGDSRNSPPAYMCPQHACALTPTRLFFSSPTPKGMFRVSWCESLTHYVGAHKRCWGQSFMGH